MNIHVRLYLEIVITLTNVHTRYLLVFVVDVVIRMAAAHAWRGARQL